jgi:hypothetical protein
VNLSNVWFHSLKPLDRSPVDIPVGFLKYATRGTGRYRKFFPKLRDLSQNSASPELNRSSLKRPTSPWILAAHIGAQWGLFLEWNKRSEIENPPT